MNAQNPIDNMLPTLRTERERTMQHRRMAFTSPPALT